MGLETTVWGQPGPPPHGFSVGSETERGLWRSQAQRPFFVPPPFFLTSSLEYNRFTMVC